MGHLAQHAQTNKHTTYQRNISRNCNNRLNIATLYLVTSKLCVFADGTKGLPYIQSLFSTHRKNSQASSEWFHPIIIFESTRCELASWLLRRVEKRLYYVKLCTHASCYHVRNIIFSNKNYTMHLHCYSMSSSPF